MYEIEIRELDEQPVAVVRGTVDRETLGSWLSVTYGTLATHLQRIGVTVVGMPFARYTDRSGDTLEVAAGFPVAEVVDRKDQVEPETLPAATAATTWHEGSYDDIAPAHDAIETWVARTGVEPLGPPWEIYHSDPERQPEATSWLVEVVQPYVEA